MTGALCALRCFLCAIYVGEFLVFFVNVFFYKFMWKILGFYVGLMWKNFWFYVNIYVEGSLLMSVCKCELFYAVSV